MTKKKEKNLDLLGFDGLIAEYRARGYTVGLTADESGGEDEAKERTQQRFLLQRILLAHPTITLSEFKIAMFLLVFKYNDHTGQCNPGKDTIAKATRLGTRTVERSRKRLRDMGVLIYETGTWENGKLISGDANTGGSPNDTNQYSFQFPPPVGETGVKPSPRTATRQPTPGRPGSTPGQEAGRTPGLPVHLPPVGGPAKQLREQPSEQPIDQVRSLARTTHAVSRSESKIEEAKEASKGASEEEPVSPPVTSKVRSRLDAIPKAKSAKRLAALACAYCGAVDDAMMPYACPNGPVRLHINCYSAYWAATFPPPPPVEADIAPPVWPPNPDTQTLN